MYDKEDYSKIKYLLDEFEEELVDEGYDRLSARTKRCEMEYILFVEDLEL